MINERNTGNLREPLHLLPLENAKDRNQVTYLSGNNTKTNINTTSTKRTSKMTNDKKHLSRRRMDKNNIWTRHKIKICHIMIKKIVAQSHDNDWRKKTLRISTNIHIIITKTLMLI